MNNLRKQAAENGSRFYTSKCKKHGDDINRYVSTGSCVECAKNYVKVKAAEIRELIRNHKETFAE